jgi:beta-glucuronidase
VLPLLRSLSLAAALSAVLAPAALGQSPAPPGSGNAPPPPPPPPPPKLVVDKPSKRTYVREGQAGRYLLGGTWYFRLDPTFEGERDRFFDQRSLSGWTPVRIPNDWNGTDAALNQQGVGWYRKEFRLPRAAGKRRYLWRIRFESVNNQARVWLNGRLLGQHAPGYLPFELDLRGLKPGRNRLVVRVSSMRGPFRDLTHWRPYGSGGWWNFGGISREVYVRRIEEADIQDVWVDPRLRCVRCDARVRVQVRVRNPGRRRKKVALALLVRGPGGTSRYPLKTVEMGRGWVLERTRSFRVRHPRLWQPGSPYLYTLTAVAAVHGRRISAFTRRFGVRKLERRPDGRLLLNGHRLQLRGASIHEDNAVTGAALTPGQRTALVRALRRAGATVARAHYPLHPALLEAFDRYGILYWSEAPVYQLPNAMLDQPAIRAKAVRVNRDVVLRDRSHPSVIAWSLANELAYDESEQGRVGPGYSRFVLDGARAVREVDRSRLVAIDRHSRIGEQVYYPAFRTLDAIGVNEYFGWYRAVTGNRPASRSDELGPYLDELHRAYPDKPLMITEFGAESTFNGPDTERGSFGFQARLLHEHLAQLPSRPFVAGALVWILKDFRVTPGWVGGNSQARATPPWNNKGLIDQTGALKPAYYLMQRLWRATRPLR